ncbi:MAG: Na/Pi cotransporter family protein [Candidatus Cloacimonetes bacterium]|nr:Na/Pi cotransporter family protein [Candidatus Cloacimonadota bacterium]
MISTIFSLLGALGVFLYGMRVMSDGLQKAAGNRLQKILNYMTSNRFVAVITGFIITAFIQSSSATTVMIVSFVNASLLTLTQAIGVIMGANIGTTVTTWIVSIIGFKFKITAIALPVVGIGMPFLFSKYKNRRDFGEILIGFGLLFLGLMFLKESVPDIKSNPEVLSFIQNWSNIAYPWSFILFVFVGTLLTIIVQSSSAAMAITVTMAFMGWINFPTAAAIVLGENIGTTVTAYLASLGTSVNARRAARAHFVFNVFGVIWMGFLFNFFVSENGIIYKLAPWNANLQENLPLNLALFHTVFNIANTLICLNFVKQLATIATKLVKPGKRDLLNQEYKLNYISTGLQDTAQMNIIEVEQEILKMSEITDNMFDQFLDVFNHPSKKMDDQVKQVKDWEELTDKMQEEISKYLVSLSNEQLNEKNIQNVNSMMRVAHELESVADSCYKLIILAQRRYNSKLKLHSKSNEEINDYSNLIREFIKLYRENINEHLHENDMKEAYNLEIKIDNYRNNLVEEVQQRIQNGADVKAELLYLDILKNFEHIGDNSLNIAQSLRQLR